MNTCCYDEFMTIVRECVQHDPPMVSQNISIALCRFGHQYESSEKRWLTFAILMIPRAKLCVGEMLFQLVALLMPGRFIKHLISYHMSTQYNKIETQCGRAQPRFLTNTYLANKYCKDIK